MPIDFPNSPTINDIYTVDGRSWRWTGSVWESVTVTISGPTGPAGVVQQTSAPSNTSVLWLDTDEVPDVPVPAGGATGQVLAKASATDYDSEWVTVDPTPQIFLLMGS